MSKISKAAAHEAALKISEPLKNKKIEALKLIAEYLKDIYLKSVPEQVKELFKTHPDYLETSTTISVSGQGISGRDNAFSIGRVPFTGGYTIYFELDSKEAAHYVKLKDKYDAAKQKYEATIQEIKNTLFALGTHKKIGEVMPNALRFLPEDTRNTQIVLQIQPIVDKVNCLISNEKACVEAI